MAGADYRHCDVCGGKAFYDANLNYETGQRGADGKWNYPETPVREVGKPQMFGAALDRLGDWAVICTTCAKTHKTAIVPITAD